jgi:spoIIIJ-associated protein
MNSSVRMKGKSVDEAVKLALEVLGKTKEDVDIRVINEAEGGVLGVFGGKEAEVEVSPKLPIDEAAKHLTQEILDKMEYITLVSIVKVEEGTVFLDIKGEDMGRIIGKEGATLDALQYLVSVILGRRQLNRVRVIIDAEGYRERRRIQVIEDADRVANDVQKTGKERSLPSMSAADRRLVHIHIQEKYPSLSSYSRGEGIGRQLVISPKEGAPKGE